MSDLVKLGAVWRGKSKDGKTMLTGLMGDARLIILPNGFKTEEKHPDYIVYVASPEKKEPVKPITEFVKPKETLDDLPF